MNNGQSFSRMWLNFYKLYTVLVNFISFSSELKKYALIVRFNKLKNKLRRFEVPYVCYMKILHIFDFSVQLVSNHLDIYIIYMCRT